MVKHEKYANKHQSTNIPNLAFLYIFCGLQKKKL